MQIAVTFLHVYFYVAQSENKALHAKVNTSSQSPACSFYPNCIQKQVWQEIIFVEL